MKLIIKHTILTSSITLFTFLFSFNCYIPYPRKSDSNSNGDNTSSNFMFVYSLLLVNQSNANYCPKPTQILRKNVNYPITLTFGEPYYFHYTYLDNAKPQEETRTYLLKITKQSGTNVTYKENTYCNSASSRFYTVTPTSAIATEQTYDLLYSNTFRQSWQIPNLYSVEVSSGDPNITLRQE
ncbi:hypothetical protein AB3N60_06030 [Leptospira sp. WS39.C2]